MTTLARTSSNPFDHLWRTHHRTVHRFVRRRCSLSCTDDIVAETFTSAAAALSGGQDIDIGWLMTVARRRIADYWRSHERDQRILARHKQCQRYGSCHRSSRTKPPISSRGCRPVSARHSSCVMDWISA